MYLSQKMQGRNHDCSWENKIHSPVFVCLPFWIFLDLWRGSGLQKWSCFSMLGGKTQKWKMDSVVIFCEQMGFSDFFEDGFKIL